MSQALWLLLQIEKNSASSACKRIKNVQNCNLDILPSLVRTLKNPVSFVSVRLIPLQQQHYTANSLHITHVYLPTVVLNLVWLSEPRNAFDSVPNL